LSTADIVVALVSGLGSGIVVAGATLAATRRTLRHETDSLATERDRESEKDFERASERAARQLSAATALLDATGEPERPYFLIDYDALEALLTYRNVSDVIAADLEVAIFRLRRYNAAAMWANNRDFDATTEGRVKERWDDASRAVSEAADAWFEAAQRIGTPEGSRDSKRS